jgi:branched-subunit amino acid aminotransferase/4-amino-4-deoxychorismate lyase
MNQNREKPDLFMYFDGDYLLESQPLFGVSDTAQMWGYSVSDTIRTFGKRLHGASDHISRLVNSCSEANIDFDISPSDVQTILSHLVEKNIPLVTPEDEFLIIIYVIGNWTFNLPTASDYPPSRLLIHCSTINFTEHAKFFTEGQKVRTSTIKQIPSESLPATIKHRSRMHFVIADKEAKSIESDASPLLLDYNENISESIYANFFIVKNNTIQTPPIQNILPGITRKKIITLAKQIGLGIEEKHLTLEDAYSAEEAFFTSTSRIITPISSIDGISIGDAIPGELTQKLLMEYSKNVGVDIVDQFLRN